MSSSIRTLCLGLRLSSLALRSASLKVQMLRGSYKFIGIAMHYMRNTMS